MKRERDLRAISRRRAYLSTKLHWKATNVSTIMKCLVRFQYPGCMGEEAKDGEFRSSSGCIDVLMTNNVV